MNGMRIFAALLATLCLFPGFLMAHGYEAEFGGTLFIAGAIIICGILINSAILKLNKRPQLTHVSHGHIVGREPQWLVSSTRFVDLELRGDALNSDLRPCSRLRYSR